MHSPSKCAFTSKFTCDFRHILDSTSFTFPTHLDSFFCTFQIHFPLHLESFEVVSLLSVAVPLSIFFAVAFTSIRVLMTVVFTITIFIIFHLYQSRHYHFLAMLMIVLLVSDISCNLQETNAIYSALRHYVESKCSCLSIRLDDVQARLKETHNEFENVRKRARKAKMEFEATKKQRFDPVLFVFLYLHDMLLLITWSRHLHIHTPTNTRVHHTDRACTVRENQGEVSLLLRSRNVRESQGNLQWSGANGIFILLVREGTYLWWSLRYSIFFVYIYSLSFSMFYLQLRSLINRTNFLISFFIYSPGQRNC